MLLDLEIRRRTDGTKSLDDVMRFLYREFGQKNRNYTPADMQRVCEMVAGGSLEEFFRRYVRGRDELDYSAALNTFGLYLRGEMTSETAGKPYLGADLALENGKLLVKRVYAGAPAYNQGLNVNDEIIALDGWRVTLEQLNKRIAEKKKGDVIILTLFRADELRAFQFTLDTRPEPDYRIMRLPDPTLAQQRLYRGWLNASLVD